MDLKIIILKEPKPKKKMYYMIPIYKNLESRLIYNNREQMSVFPWGQAEEGRVVTNRHKETFGNKRSVHYPDCRASITAVYVSQSTTNTNTAVYTSQSTTK